RVGVGETTMISTDPSSRFAIALARAADRALHIPAKPDPMIAILFVTCIALMLKKRRARPFRLAQPRGDCSADQAPIVAVLSRIRPFRGSRDTLGGAALRFDSLVDSAFEPALDFYRKTRGPFLGDARGQIGERRARQFLAHALLGAQHHGVDATH